MIRRLIVTGALAATATTALVGCGSDDKTATSTPAASQPAQTPGKAPVVLATGPEYTWATKVCTAVSTGGLKLTMPTLDPSDAAKSKQGIIAFLNDLSKQLKFLSTSLTTLGAPPVPGTKPTYLTALDHLDKSRKSIDSASASLDKAKVTDTKSLQTSLASVGKAMGSLGTYQGPTGDLAANPALKAVFAKSQGCAGVVSS